jgi:hypothetical protein
MYAHVLGGAWRTDRQAFRRLAGDAAGDSRVSTNSAASKREAAHDH